MPHGGLNQAGKVRNLTPKVPKTEKKKKLTGRAQNRAKYAQRFDGNGQLVGTQPNKQAKVFS